MFVAVERVSRGQALTMTYVKSACSARA